MGEKKVSRTLEEVHLFFHLIAARKIGLAAAPASARGDTHNLSGPYYV